MKISGWNVRGLNIPLKQSIKVTFMKDNNVDIMGVLECKLNETRLDSLMRSKLVGMKQCNNFGLHDAGRILVIWNSTMVDVIIVGIISQLIHLSVSCKVTSHTFLVTFVYDFHTIVNRRSMWEKLLSFDLGKHEPWMVLGDFNFVLRDNEKKNGQPITSYQVRDFVQCCMNLGLSDTNSSEFFYTWTNNTVWSKLDRVLVNDIWVQRDLPASTVFLTPGCSDHSPSITTILGNSKKGKKSFIFYDMWTGHEVFLDTIRQSWQGSIYGTAKYRICKRMKRLKMPLKALNREHFSHIFARTRTAREELERL